MKLSKRLKELSEQAYEECNPDTKIFYTPPGYMERFTELIIKDCCDIVNKRTQHNNPNDCMTVLDIKEHFGIE